MKNAAMFFVKNIRFTAILTFFVFLAGYLSFQSLKSESFPNVNLGKVVITTVYRGAASDVIESKITKVIEEEIRSVSGLKRVRSISQPGLSTIFTEVDIDNYDVEEVVADLQRAVDRASDLPQDLEQQPQFIEIKVDEMPIIEVSVTGGENSFERNKVAYELAETLRDNKKISTVSFQGYGEPQFRVKLDAKKLQELYVSPQEVVMALKNTTVSVPAGFIENEESKFLIKIDGKLKSIEKLNKLSVRSANTGPNILLEDIAEVTLEDQKPSEESIVDGVKSTNLIIAKKSNGDIIELSKDINKALESYTTKYKNFNFNVYSDEGLRVENRINVLYSNALVGFALVILFLLIFLSGRVGIVTAFSLPLAVFATLAYMSLSGMSLNTITIMALIISIGMLVDNAVVISENFTRLLDSGASPFEAASKSIASLWAPVTATALTTIAAFLPMMVTKGIMGEFIIGIPLIVTASLLFSLFESFFFLPSRLVLVAKKKRLEASSKTQDWFASFADKSFKPFLAKVIKHRYLSALGFLGLIFSSFFVMAVFNSFILFPANQTEIYVGRAELKHGTPLSKTNAVIVKVQSEIKKVLGEDLKIVTADSGTSMMDWSDPKGKKSESVAIFKIFMTEVGRNLKTSGVLERLRSIKVPETKRLTFEAMANGPPVGDPLTLRVRSSNEKELNEISQELLSYLSGIEGVVDLRLNEQISEPEVKLEVDTLKAQSLGLSLNDIGFTFQTAFSGIPVNDVNLNNRTVDYFVEYLAEDKKSIENIRAMSVSNRFGKLIPVESFSKIVESEAQPFIERYDFKRTKTITSDLETDKITSLEVNRMAKDKFLELSEKYPTVSLVFGGEAENTAESMESLASAMVLSIIGIFALLILVFNSFAKPFIVLSTIPLGLVGVSYAFFLQSLPLSFLAMIGVVGLSGIIVNSGIVLISFIEERKGENPHQPIEEILAESSVLRLKAVVITSLTTISGLIPTAYGVGGSDDFIRPMAMSISWGLLSGTVLTLVWVPCAYMILEDINKKLKRLF